MGKSLSLDGGSLGFFGFWTWSVRKAFGGGAGVARSCVQLEVCRLTKTYTAGHWNQLLAQKTQQHLLYHLWRGLSLPEQAEPAYGE